MSGNVLADGLELFVHIFSRDSKAVAERHVLNAGVMLIYAASAFVGLVVLTKHSDKEFSGILTLSAGVQLVGFTILAIKVHATKSVAGISSKTLELYALFFLCRLASTTMKSGYIPVDKSGRYVYQLCDAFSFLLVFHLLWCIHKTYKWTYQADKDTMAITPLIPPCIVLGYFIHADLNRSFFFDTVWAISTNIDTVAMLPQLWKMSKCGGQVDGCTAHFTFALVVSRAMALAFWWTAYADLADDGFHVAAGKILVANGIQLLLAGDFLYYYLRATMRGTRMSLPAEGAATTEL